jgi:hypothetical protein
LVWKEFVEHVMKSADDGLKDGAEDEIGVGE